MNKETFLHELKKRNGTLDRIYEWKQYADRDENKINRFIFRWISLNGLYSASYTIDHTQDKGENVSELKLIEEFNKKFIINDETLASKVYSKDVDKVFKDKIKDKSKKMGTFLTKLENTKKVEEKVCNMVIIAYKIRCRLFHGEKNPELEVNVDVSKAADEVIESVLNQILPSQIDNIR